eukprot:364086-Chlamydomonas_euryale.AAC.2
MLPVPVLKLLDGAYVRLAPWAPGGVMQQGLVDGEPGACVDMQQGLVDVEPVHEGSRRLGGVAAANYITSHSPL